MNARKRLAHVPVLSLEQMRALPEPRPQEGGVYFLWLADELRYVGRSRNILFRVEIFRSYTRYGRVTYYEMPPMPFDRITFIALEAETKERFHFMAKDYERAYIATYLPAYNSDCNDAGNQT